MRKWLERETFNSFHFNQYFLNPALGTEDLWGNLIWRKQHNTEENWITKKVSVKIKDGGQLHYTTH